MLGGRTADLLGRRRIFIAGLALFSGASLAAAWRRPRTTLIAARAIQGVGAAIISPAALSILMTTFEEGAERNKALGIWGADRRHRRRRRRAARRDPDRAAELVVDLLHQRAGRARRDRRGSRSTCARARSRRATRSFDLLGAILATAGMSLLVYALVQTVDHSWSAPRTIGLFVGRLRAAGRASSPPSGAWTRR